MEKSGSLEECGTDVSYLPTSETGIVVGDQVGCRISPDIIGTTCNSTQFGGGCVGEPVGSSELSVCRAVVSGDNGASHSIILDVVWQNQ